MDAFLQYALIGLGVGGIYALAGQGIVVIYRGSGVINLALGGMAMVGAYGYYELATNGFPLVLAVIGGVLLSAALATCTYTLIIRRLNEATQLVRLGAILGVQATIVGFMFWRYGDAQRRAPSILPSEPATWVSELFGDTVRVGSDRIWLLAVGALSAVICWSLYRFTRFGLTTRAVAENPSAVATLGRSPDKVAAINWALGGGFIGLAGILVATISNLSVVQFNLLLVPALAAALAARFASFPITWVTGVGIGVVQTLITSGGPWVPALLREPGWAIAFPFLVIIALLIATGRGLPTRGDISARQTHTGTGRVRPGLVVPAILLLVVLSLRVMSVDWVVSLTYSVGISIVALSIVVVTGLAGQLSLAQLTLAGFGAYVAARVVAGETVLGVSFGDGPHSFTVGLIAAVMVTAVLGVLIAIPALRTRGFSLAIATLGLALTVDEIVFQNSKLTGGQAGTVVSPPSLFGIDLDPVLYPERYLVFAILSLTALLLIVANLRRSPSGRRMLAVSGNERAAASMGISVAGTKIYAFAVAAAIAAFGGVVLAFRNSTILLEGYGVDGAIFLTVTTMLGGIGFLGSAMMAGTMGTSGVGNLILDPIFGTSPILPFLIGITLIIILLRHPDGIVSEIVRNGRRVLDRLPKLPRVGRLGAFGSRARDRDSGPVDASSLVPIAPQALEISGLSVSFGSVHALRGVDLRVEPGTIVGLIGPNGAGKTTFLDAASGFSRKREGEVRLGGVEIGGMTPKQRARAGLSRSFQSLELFETLTVSDHMRLASEPSTWWGWMTDLVWPRRRPLSPAARVAIEELGLVNDLDRTPEELSHGRRRLLAIARTAAARPSVLMLDEPAAGLDDNESAELGRLLTRLARNWGMGILLVEHDLELVMSISDRVTVLDFGKVIAEGTPEEVGSAPQVIRAYVGSSDPDAEAAANSAEGIDVAHVAHGLAASTRVAPAFLPDRASVLRTRGLNGGYGRVPAIREVNIEVKPGEVVAVLGANGAGKTTMLRTIAGGLRAMGGTVEWEGADVTKRSMDWRASRGLVMVPEQRSVFMDLTAAENLRIGTGETERALALFPELEEKLTSKGGLLSGGQQQMLSLGRALAMDPRLLLADELSLGLAPIVVSRLLAAVREAADGGAGVLLVEQHARAALDIADRAYLVRRGSIVLEGTAEEMRDKLGEIEEAYLSNARASNSVKPRDVV